MQTFPVARIAWPDDHPNTKVLMFVETSRQVIARAPNSPIVEGTSSLLDQIEVLIDQMVPGKTHAQINQLVAQVGPLVNEAASRMNIIRARVDAEQKP